MPTPLDLRRRWNLARPLLAAYWLTLAAALSLYACARPDSPALTGLWLGAVAGTLLGNLLALCNLRAWAAGLVALLLSPFLLVLAAPLHDTAQLWPTFVPALACGFLLLGARASLAAFWFPALLFAITLIDRLDGDAPAAGLDARAVTLQALIAAAFLLLLAMVERRRIALWHAVGNVPHVAGRATILREPAGRGAARAGWSLATVALVGGLTAFIAPRLWRGETLDGRLVTQPVAGPAVVVGAGLPCCPVAAPEPRARVREYFDLADGVGHPAPRRLHDEPGVDCRACNGAVAGLGTLPAGTMGRAASDVTTANAPAPAAASVAATTNLPSPIAAAVPSTPPAPSTSRTIPHDRPAAPPAATMAPPAPTTPPSASAPTTTPPSARAPATQPPRRASFTRPTPPLAGDDLVGWLLSLLVAVAALASASLLLRPLRRAVTLRHLRRPYWPEPLQQRVSNLWQLALIGLRDAGLRPSASELPEEVARRAPVAGVQACASILARARHGLGLDDGDLAAMRAAAEGTFSSARRHLGVVARAASWLRWPLL